MKSIAALTTFIAALALLCACGGNEQKGQARINGNIGGLQADTILIYGADVIYTQGERVPVKDGKFETYLSLDTITQLWMLFPENQRTYPLFAGKNERIGIKADSVGAPYFNLTGNLENELLTQFMSQGGVQGSQGLQRIDSLVSHNPTSVVGAFLLAWHLAGEEQPDLARIDTVLHKLNTEVQHHPQMQALANELKNAQRTKTNQKAPLFKARDTKGKLISGYDYDKKWLLVHFWASWDQMSRQQNTSFYKTLYKSKKNDKQFAMLGVSLDVDRQNWVKAVANDSLLWDQISELQGLTGEIPIGLNIRTLPSNLLISPDGKLVARNVGTAEQLEQLMKEQDDKQ